MKVKELMVMLAFADQEAEVLINDNGSILNTASVEEVVDYNKDNDTSEFFIMTEEY